MSDLFLSIDSGTQKCGFAILNEKGEVKNNYIVNVEQLKNEIETLTKKYNFNKIILGKGTGWKKVKKIIEEVTNGKVDIELFDERYSTELAYKRNGSGIRQTINLMKTLLSIEKPVDNISAVIIGEKYLKVKGGSK